MDFEFIRTYAPMYVEAAKLTMSIAFFGILLSTLVGFICCLIRYYKIPILQTSDWCVYRAFKKYSAINSVVFLVFRIAEARNLFKF